MTCVFEMHTDAEASGFMVRNDEGHGLSSPVIGSEVRGEQRSRSQNG